MPSQEIPDLLILCDRYVRLLKAFSKEAFVSKNDDYLGEVAAKLRLLVSDEGANKALLLKLIDEFDADDKVTLIGPGPPQIVPLREFVKMDAFAFRLPTSGELVSFTKVEIVKTFAEKLGAAHVDWTVPEKFHQALEAQVSIHGLQQLAWEIQSVAKAVITVSERFLSKLTPEMVRKKTVQRIRKRTCQQPQEFNDKGLGLAHCGEMRDAIRCFERAIRDAPQKFEFRMNLALALRNDGQLDSALQVYNALLEEQPENSAVLSQYGYTLSLKKKPEDAATVFSRILELRPTDADALHDRGVCFLQADKLDDAAADFESALAQKPNSKNSHCSLAAVRSQQGRFEESLACLERVRALMLGSDSFTPVGDPDFQRIVDDPVYGERIKELFPGK